MTRRAKITETNRPGLCVAEAVARLLLTMERAAPALELVQPNKGMLPPDESSRPLSAVIERPL